MYWCIELIKSLVLQACQHPNKHPPLPSDWHSCLHCGPGRCLSAVLCDHQPHPSDPDCPWQAPGGSTKSFLSDRSSQFVTSLTFAQQEQMITSQRSTAEAQHCIAFQGWSTIAFPMSLYSSHAGRLLQLLGQSANACYRPCRPACGLFKVCCMHLWMCF